MLSHVSIVHKKNAKKQKEDAPLTLCRRDLTWAEVTAAPGCFSSAATAWCNVDNDKTLPSEAATFRHSGTCTHLWAPLVAAAAAAELADVLAVEAWTMEDALRTCWAGKGSELRNALDSTTTAAI